MEALNFPTAMFFGDEAFADLKKYQGESILVITSRHGMNSAAAKKLQAVAEENNSVKIFNGVLPDPPLSVIAEGTQLIKDDQPTVVIGLGGGSAMDAAKAMKVDAGFTGDFIEIPTTSGTGSEINDLAVVTDDQTNLKLPKLDVNFQPDKAYMIPELTASMPTNTTVNTGMDILTHAIEAYVAGPLEPVFRGHNVYTDGMAKEAIQLVFANLPKVVENPNDMAARKQMMDASALASMAFIKAGLGAVHGISHSTGARLHIAHGRVNSLLLPEVIEFNAGTGKYEINGQDETAQRYADLANMLAKTDRFAGKEGARAFADMVRDLEQQFQIERHFSAIVDQAAFDNMIDTIKQTAVQDPCSIVNPRKVTEADVAAILNNLR